jgi:hypothetical protein
MGPHFLAILAKQWIEGDDALLRLAQARFVEASLGGEIYPGTPDQLRHQLNFAPSHRPCTVHLPRNLNLLQADSRRRVMEFAAAAAGRVHGLIVHDHEQFADRPDETISAFRDLDRQLAALPHRPLVFVEYAAGLVPDFFASLFERTVDLTYVSSCIDISHVGIRACQTLYAEKYPGIDVCSLKGAPDLADKLNDIDAVVVAARSVVIELVRRVASLGKPLHFHLHDGHPLSTLSRYGVSDHLSFLQQVPLPVEFHGRRLVGGIFGPAGLRAVMKALHGLAPERVSLMLEIHPQPGRLPLGRHGHLFSHWKDQANAEQMNFWLDVLVQNAVLLRDAYLS